MFCTYCPWTRANHQPEPEEGSMHSIPRFHPVSCWNDQVVLCPAIRLNVRECRPVEYRTYCRTTSGKRSRRVVGLVGIVRRHMGLFGLGCLPDGQKDGEAIEKKRPLKNAQFCSRLRKAKILTTGIPLVFRGLRFESDAKIAQKGAFFKGL